MFCFPIYDVLLPNLWCFTLRSMMFWSSFYDRLQPILWCFERLRMMFFISTKWKISFQWVKASQTISNRFLPFGRTVESETLHRKVLINNALYAVWRVFEKLFWFVIIGNFSDLPTGGSNEDGHQGTDDIEETVGKIGEGGYSENGGLCHTAGVPGNEYGGNGGGILTGAAQ